MTTALYKHGRDGLADGSIALLTDDIRVILIDTDDYTVDLVNHDYLDDIAAGARVAVSDALTSKSVTDGVFDAADINFTTVSGDESEALVLYKHTGVEGTSDLIAYIDKAYGLPVIPNGGTIQAHWDTGANKIFSL